MYYLDLFLFPIYVLFPILIIFYVAVKYIKDPIEKKFFYQGFMLKIVGGLSGALIYTIYYKSGDTTYYFSNGSALVEYFSLYPENIVDFLFRNDLSSVNDPSLIPFKLSLFYCFSKSTYLISKIGMFLSLFTFGSFYIASIVSSYISFWGSWKFYKFIIGIYPDLKKSLGYAIFFVPSVIFWGSGIFKDTYTLLALYLLIISVVSIFGLKKINLSLILYFIISFYTLVTIRSFYILAVMPFILIWIFSFHFRKIKNNTLKFLMFPFFIISVGVIITMSLNITTKELEELSTENLQSKVQGFQTWHTSLKGSAYSIGTIEFTPLGIISKIPAAINVTFFRPYIWEATKPIIFLSFLQSFFYLCFTFYTMYKMKFIFFFIEFFKSPDVLFFLGFSLVFAFIAGFTSYNFGALDRYKIPCLSPYLIGLILLRANYNKKYLK